MSINLVNRHTNKFTYYIETMATIIGKKIIKIENGNFTICNDIQIYKILLTYYE